MNPVWMVMVVMVAFLAVLHFKNKGRRRKKSEPVYSRRIEGFHLVAYVQPEMQEGCLFDHGMQFGRGFRRKEGPALPHGPGCRCKAVPFSFSSSEVFHGALRDVVEYPGTLQGLSRETGQRLHELLKKIESTPPAEDLEAYLALADLETFTENERSEIEPFLKARYQYKKNGSLESATDHVNSPSGEKPGEASET